MQKMTYEKMLCLPGRLRQVRLRYLTKQNLRVMKLILLLLTVTFLQVSATGFAQQVTLKKKNASLEKIFEDIYKQTGYQFVYTYDLIQNANKVSINAKNEPLKKVLETCFRGQPFTYVMMGNAIIVKKKEKADASQIQAIAPIEVTGKVTDSLGNPLIGVTIKAKEGGTGTVTDANGNYSITVPDDAMLVVSYVGYQTQEVSVNGRTEINIELKASVSELNQLVVVGYGTQKKKDLTGAVSSIDISKVVETRPVTNLSSALVGQAPGLYVRSGNGDPGHNASLLIRGQGTLNNSSPLVIIDGVEGDISTISLYDIANISILKDASAAAIYGSRAANGVILITTKRGQKGKFTISYNGYIAIQTVGHLMPLVDNSIKYMELVNEAAKNSGLAQVFSDNNIQMWKDHEGDDPLLWPNTNWADGLFRKVTTINHNISGSGGTDKLTTYMSFNYAESPGLIENTGYDRYSFRSHSQLQATKWLKVGMNLNGVHTDKDRGSEVLGAMFINSILAVPTVVPRAPDGRYGGTNNSEDNPAALSPIFYVNALKGSNRTNAFTSRFYANITPVEGLNIDGSYSFDLSNHKITSIPTQNDRWNFQTNTILVSGKKDLFVRKQHSYSTRNFMDGNISYEKTFLDKLYIKLMIGGSQEKYISEYLTVTRKGLINENLDQINAATKDPTASGSLNGDWGMRSYFGRLNLSLDEKYLAQFNLRRDGSSRFTPSSRWGNFPSGSVGWRISEEPFMKSVKDSWLNELKVRASYGVLGNNAIGDYETVPALTPIRYVFGKMPADGFYQARISNSGLEWESTYITNIGLDFSLLNHQLSGSLDLYNKLTKNILIDLPAPNVNGTVGIPPVNSAQVRNRGFELTLNWKDKIGDVEYFMNANFTYNKNKVVKFKGDDYSLSGTKMIKEGLPINTQYLWIVDRIVQTEKDEQKIQDMVDNAPTGENPFPFGKPELGDFFYKDLNGDGVVDAEDRKNVGNGQNPLYFYSFNLGANYKGFTISVFFEGVGGLETYFLNSYYTPSIRWTRIINEEIADDRWYEGRTTPATYPRLLLNDSKNARPSNFWLSDMSYLKIRNIQIGYTLKSKVLQKVHISKAHFYISLENYFTFTRYKGLDPEVNGVGYPNIRQAVLGLNVNF